MAKKRKKDKEKKRPLFFLKLSISYNMGGLLILAIGLLFLAIMAMSMVVVAYQNYAQNMKEGRLEKTLEYLFPSEPPRPERGKGASLSASSQNIYGWDEKYANLVSFAVIYHANIYVVDSGLVKNVIKQESDGYPYIVSAKDCKGLMQLHPINYNYQDIYHPWVNVREGIKTLAPLIDRYGVYGGLLAYNGSSPKNPYFESIVFARKVLDGI